MEKRCRDWVHSVVGALGRLLTAQLQEAPFCQTLRRIALSGAAPASRAAVGRRGGGHLLQLRRNRVLVGLLLLSDPDSSCSSSRCSYRLCDPSEQKLYGKSPLFGQYFVLESPGTIKVGDPVYLLGQ